MGNFVYLPGSHRTQVVAHCDTHDHTPEEHILCVKRGTMTIMHVQHVVPRGAERNRRRAEKHLPRVLSLVDLRSRPAPELEDVAGFPQSRTTHHYAVLRIGVCADQAAGKLFFPCS